VFNGDTTPGEGYFLGSRATLFPLVLLGKGCMLGSHTAVKASAGDYKIISVKGQFWFKTTGWQRAPWIDP